MRPEDADPLPADALGVPVTGVLQLPVLLGATWAQHLDRPVRARGIPMSPAIARQVAGFCRDVYECAAKEWAREDAEAVLFEAERALHGLG